MVKKSTLINKLDKIVGQRARAKGKCEAQGFRVLCSPVDTLQWCHVKSRSYKTLRWDPQNYLCMCAKHHFFFHQQPDTFGEFLDTTFGPERRKYLDKKLREPEKITVKWLQEKLNELS